MALVLVAAALVLPPAGQRVINGPHQARFAVLAQDMLDRHTWFGGRIAGEPYRNKPPLYPWAVVVLSLATGAVTPATARAPSALAAIGSVAFTYLLGQRLFGRRAALWSAAVLLTSFEIFAESQTATPDMLVVFFAVAAAYFFWIGIGTGAPRVAMPAFYTAVALGVFAKGPVGLLPIVVGGVWLWTEQGGAGLRRLWSAPGLAILVGLTLLWLGPYLAGGSESFARDVVWADWLDQYLGGPRLQPLRDTIGEWWLGLLPWTPVLPLAVTRAFRDRRHPAIRFTLLWQVITLVIILISNTPRGRYLLPSYPAAALLIAWWADRHGAVPTRFGSVMSWVALASAVIAASSLVWYPHLYPRVFPPPSWATVGPALLILAAGLAMMLGLRGARPGVLIHAVAAVALVVFGVGIWPYNAWVNQEYGYRRLERIVADQSRHGQIGAYFSRELYQVYFYAGTPLVPITDPDDYREFLARRGRPVVLVNRENDQAVDAACSPGVAVVARLWLGPDEILVVRAPEQSER